MFHWKTVPAPSTAGALERMAGQKHQRLLEEFCLFGITSN